MISGLVLVALLLSVLLPIGMGLFTLFVILQYKRLQRLQRRLHLFRRASASCEQRRKKTIADALLKSACPLFVYEGAQNNPCDFPLVKEQVISPSCSFSELKIPCPIWQTGGSGKENKSPSYISQGFCKTSVSSSEHLRLPVEETDRKKSSSISCSDEIREMRHNERQKRVECSTEYSKPATIEVFNRMSWLSSDKTDKNNSKLQLMEDVDCSICLDSVRAGQYVRKLPCSHIFHASCVEKWLTHAHRCPLCNSDLLTNVPIDYSYSEEEQWIQGLTRGDREYQMRPRWNRPFAHIRYLFQEYPIEWQRLQYLFEDDLDECAGTE